MDSIQSKCAKLGIREIFETRNDYEAKYPSMRIIDHSPNGGKIICIARTLFHLLNKTGELKKGLERGLTFELACVDPTKITPSLEKVSQLYGTDIDSALRALKGLLTWATKTKANFSYFDYEDGEKRLVWDLSFGRDLTQKKVIILKPGYLLGKDLMSRYMTIYADASVQIRYSNGSIQQNSLGWQF